MSDASTKRFSIVIPTYNYGRFLPTTLDSVLTQKSDADEVIVVDDGSTDNTTDVVARYRNAITYLPLQANIGPAAAWGVGLSHAKGSYVCKLDADDWYLEGALDSFEAAFEIDPNIGMVAGPVLNVFDESGFAQEVEVGAPTGIVGAAQFRWLLLRRFFFYMPGVSVRRSALNNAMPRRDLWMPHDWEFFIRTLEGWSCFVLTDPVGVYRTHSSSVTRTASQEARLEADLLKLSDLALDPASEPHMTDTETRVFHDGLAETYLRVERLLGIPPIDAFRRLLFASRLNRRARGNSHLSAGLTITRVLVAKLRNLFRWLITRKKSSSSRYMAPTRSSANGSLDGSGVGEGTNV